MIIPRLSRTDYAAKLRADPLLGSPRQLRQLL